MTEIAVHPEFAAKGGFGHLRLGRVKPAEPPKLALGAYLDTNVLVPPDSIDYVSAVASWPMYGNDALGDCEWATVGHQIQAWSAAAGAEMTPPTSDIEQAYWETGDPPAATGEAGGPTDDGRDDVSVLSYWRKNGVPGIGHQIAAYASVDPGNLAEVKTALWLFGGIRIAVELPLTAESQSVWDVVQNAGPNGEPGSWGGHSIPGEAYDENGIIVITWGAPLRMTYAFFADYAATRNGGACYAVISTDWLAKATQESPQGFNVAQLTTDLADVTSGKPVPSPVPPTPTPPPTPPTPPAPPATQAYTTLVRAFETDAASADEARALALAKITADPALVRVKLKSEPWPAEDVEDAVETVLAAVTEGATSTSQEVAEPADDAEAQAEATPDASPTPAPADG